MFSFTAYSHIERSLCLTRRLFVALVFGTVSLGQVGAQTAPASGSAAAAAHSPAGSPALGFSIESEMLTYRALESNSEAVACDIAAYLDGIPATFTKDASRGTICSVRANGKASVVLLPFDQGVIDGFQLWRADMEIMNELRQRAITYCPATPQIEVRDRGTTATTAAASTALNLTPAGAALSLAQGVIGMVASQVDTTPVEGTIQDQAFINGVARQLRVLSVSVLAPNLYHPFSLNGLDEAKSPFLSNFDKFLASHDCIEAKDSKSDNALQELQGEMNTFLSTLNGGTTPATKPNAAQGSGGPAAPAPGGAQTQTSSSSSSLMAILSADGLAQKLGVDPATGKLPDNGEWQHILFLKALESGGSLTRFSNIFGTKIRYSGGAVGTYALVRLDGELECSGDVFDFGGSVQAKNFERDLRKYTPDPSSQIVFQRGGCSLPGKP